MAERKTNQQALGHGVPDPHDPSRWLVRPWPTSATFCEVVRHFLNAYMWRLQGHASTAQLLAYFKSYQAALHAASTEEPTCVTAWQWRDELLTCIANCIVQYQDQNAGQAPHTPPAQRVRSRNTDSRYGAS